MTGSWPIALVVMTGLLAFLAGAAPAPASRLRTVTTREQIASICATPNADGTWTVEAIVQIQPDAEAPFHSESYRILTGPALAAQLDKAADTALLASLADNP